MMRNQRLVGPLLAAAVLLSSLGASQAHAQYFFGLNSGPFLNGPLTMPYSMPYTPYSNYFFTYPMAQSYIPYVSPYPSYGILPPPFVTAHYYEAQRAQVTNGNGKTAADYGYRIDTPARMRNSLYPAVPYEKKAGEHLNDLRRVRYELDVPYANAVVYIDGVKTKQTGLKRVYVTPPMDEDRYYTTTVKVEWVDQFQKMRQREQTFTFVAGETVRYQFKE